MTTDPDPAPSQDRHPPDVNPKDLGSGHNQGRQTVDESSLANTSGEGYGWLCISIGRLQHRTSRSGRPRSRSAYTQRPHLTAALCAFSSTFPVAQRHAVDRRNLEADLPLVRSEWSAGGLRGSLAEVLHRGSTPPRHGHITPELARDMRHVRAFARRALMYKPACCAMTAR